jgi:hypothetical protein
MTKKQRRDKESSAKSHRKKINGRRSIAGIPCPFSAICRGIVKLARRWPCGKVAKKARIPVALLAVVRGARTHTISEDWHS